MALQLQLPLRQTSSSHPSAGIHSTSSTPMLGRVVRHSLSPQLFRSSTPSSGSSLRQICSARSKGSSSRAGDDGSSSSNSSYFSRVQSELDVLYQSIAQEASQNYTNSQGMGSFSHNAAETLRQVQAKVAAAARQGPGNSSSSSSSSSSSMLAGGVAPSLLHYADLLSQYNSYTASQRRQLLEGLQLQLLPRVNALVGVAVPALPISPSLLQQAAPHSLPAKRGSDSSGRPSHPAIAASGLVDDQQQQQQQPAAASKKQIGPRKGTAVYHLQQQQQQQLSDEQPTSSANVAGSYQQQRQEAVLQDLPHPPQGVQQQQQSGKRSSGPPRLPGPPRRPTSPSQAATSSSRSSSNSSNSSTIVDAEQASAQAPAAEQPSTHASVVQQQQQQQQHWSVGPKKHIGPSRGPMRVQSAPPGPMQPPAVEPHQAEAIDTAVDPPTAAEAVEAEFAVQQQQQQEFPQAGPSSSSSSGQEPGRRVVGPPIHRSASANGPYLPRRHTPYPPAATQAELQRLHQQQRQQQQQSGLIPAWQLYFPLPEELGGPARAAPVAAAAAAGEVQTLHQQLGQMYLPDAANSAAAAAGLSSSDLETDQNGADISGGSSSNEKRRGGGPRDKALSEQKWQALLVSARKHHQRVLQEQQQQQEATGQLKQRTPAWLRSRESRLTGSALANMLSWFDGQDRADHVRLWKEKLGLQQPPPPNKMMLYGTRKEVHALSSYQHLAPQEEVQEMSLALWGTDNAHDWLAASPDGLIKSTGLEGVASAGDGVGGVSEEVAAWVKEQTGTSPEGVLEIKCPFKASPQVDSPYLPRKMDPYYMPQVQVLCEVLEREWAVVYYWSETQGSHMTLVHRDREYFNLLWRAMADFWWRHLVPAKLLLEADSSATDIIERMYTPRIHPYRAEIIRRSRAMVDAAPQRTFTPEETMGGAAAAAAAAAAASGVAGAAEAASVNGSNASAVGHDSGSNGAAAAAMNGSSGAPEAAAAADIGAG